MFVSIKQIFGPESYVTSPLSRCQKSLVALLRTAFLPLAIYFGRFKNVHEANRLWGCANSGKRVPFSLTHYRL